MTKSLARYSFSASTKPSQARVTHAKNEPEPVLQRALSAENWGQLIHECKIILSKNGSHRWALLLQGVAFCNLGRLDDALVAFNAGLKQWPADIDMQFSRAQIWSKLGVVHKSIPEYERLSSLIPGNYTLWLAASNDLYVAKNNSALGLACAQKARDLARNDIEMAQALGCCALHRAELGDIQNAVADDRAAIAHYPGIRATHANLLMHLLAKPGVASLEILEAALDFAKILGDRPDENRKSLSFELGEPFARLRVGFLSPDFREHSVMHFAEGLIQRLDRRQFFVVGFQLNYEKDSVTERVRAYCDEYIDLSRRLDSEKLNLINESKIDILVDLAGHTGEGGLHLMVNRLAPIQVSWLGFPATTGISSIDYKITDEVTDSAGAESEYTERLHRMPTLFCCYRPHIRHPLWRYRAEYAVAATPAIVNGYVTYGSCNNLAKLTDEVLSLWGGILQNVPNSKLLIEARNFNSDKFRSSYLDRCRRLGIPPERLILVPLEPANQYLTYHNIDIALDPFPLTGGTTSFDVLWMGLPLVSMEGDSFRSRMGTGLLSYLGKTEWLAKSKQDYSEIAIALASDIASLNRQRLSQRELVENSPLMDEACFAREFGSAMRSMWLSKLAERQYPNDQNAQSAWISEAIVSAPSEWSTPESIHVAIAPGNRVQLSEAHHQLELALAKAKASLPSSISTQKQSDGGAWLALTQLVELVLNASPYDPVALNCLTEVELAFRDT